MTDEQKKANPFASTEKIALNRATRLLFLKWLKQGYYGTSRNFSSWIFEKVLNLRYENRRCNMDVPSRGNGRAV